MIIKNISFAFFLFMFLAFNVSFGQNVISKTSLNYDWFFAKDTANSLSTASRITKWQKVSIPHTWNVTDVMDDEKGYYRGNGWYKRSFRVSMDHIGKNIYIEFNGANQVTQLFVNGTIVGTHKGGYNKFIFRIDKYLNFEAENTILIKVDNKHDDNIPPLSGDFTFFGGIYRDLYLVVKDPIHFSLNSGANGVFISTPLVSAQQASVKIKCLLQNSNTSITKKVKVRTVIKSPNGKLIADRTSSIELGANLEKEINFDIEGIKNPELWSPENPNLYKVLTSVFDSNGKLLDEVSGAIGLRWFKFDANEGFFLNGKPYKLIGASRHQDFEGLGNALSDEYHINDVKYLKNMGGNFLRIAHYPQDQSVLETCDRLGVLTSVEIPVVNTITETEGFSNNCLNMQVEMIRQNYNHPSVVI